MKSAFDHSRVGIRRVIDLIGVVAILLIGIGGQIIVLNPVRVFAPQLPMLSRQDWPGSHKTSGLEILEDRDGYEMRSFAIRLQRGQYWVLNSGAEIWQRTLWFAELDKTVEAWQRRDSRQSPAFLNKVPIKTTALGEDTPASVLYCEELPDNERICAYFAYWERWYTEVWFWSGGDQFLSLPEIQSITERVDQLLLEAPDKP
jgi:hypothetical protein